MPDDEEPEIVKMEGANSMLRYSEMGGEDQNDNFKEL